MRHVRLATPLSSALSSGITCFEVDGLPAEKVVAALADKGVIASRTPYRRHYALLVPGTSDARRPRRAHAGRGGFPRVSFAPQKMSDSTLFIAEAPRPQVDAVILTPLNRSGASGVISKMRPSSFAPVRNATPSPVQANRAGVIARDEQSRALVVQHAD